MKSSCTELQIINSDFSQLTADGASNAIGSMQEFEVLTRAGHSNDVDFAVFMPIKMNAQVVRHQEQSSLQR